MDKKNIKFGDTEIEEYEFHQNKSPILINDIDINIIVVSNELPFAKQDFKYFIGYKDSEKIRSLCILRPQMVICKRNFDEYRRIYFLLKKETTFIRYSYDANRRPPPPSPPCLLIFQNFSTQDILIPTHPPIKF